MKRDEFEILEEHWSLGFADVSRLLSPLFRRSEARDIAEGYLRGLLSCVERKNGWQLSESVGKSTPYAIKHLLDRCRWDADSLRDELQLYVNEH